MQRNMLPPRPLACWLIAVLMASLPGTSIAAQARRPSYEVLKQAYARAERSANLPQLTEESTLQDYLRYAALNNPGLRASFNRWKAALEKVPQVSALPDPRLSFGYFVRDIETRVGPQEWRIAIMQKFPWFGKLDLKGTRTGMEARARAEQLQAKRLHILHRVKSAYAEYWYLSRAIAVTRKHLELVEYLEKTARTKYSTGKASHSTVIKAQVELGKLRDRLESLRGLKDPRAAKLNAALGRSADASLPWPVELPEKPVKLNDGKLRKNLREMNPDLRALQWKIRKAEAGADLSKLQYYPDVTAGLGYMATGSAVMSGVDDSGKDPILLSLSINVPLWRKKYRAGEREAKSQLRRAKKQFQDQTLKLESKLKLALFEVRDARRKINLYEDTLVPRAEQSLEATRTAFRTGKASFQSLLDTERMLLEFRLAGQRALADHLRSTAQLEMLVGQRMEAESEKSEDSPDAGSG